MSKQAQKVARRLVANLRANPTAANLDSQLERASVMLSGFDLDAVQELLRSTLEGSKS